MKLRILTGNDLETSKVPLSVLFCIIEQERFILNTKIIFFIIIYYLE